MSLKIREFSPVDLDVILSIEKECFDKDAFDRNVFLEFYRTVPYGFLVAEYNSKIIGYVITSAERSGDIMSIAVLPKYRGNGIGSSLLKKGLEILKSKNVESVRLMVRKSNIVARNFYRKHKFEEAKIMKNHYGDEDAVFMYKKI
jgi:ribosomal-protein-alanine N-acetyltransferase